MITAVLLILRKFVSIVDTVNVRQEMYITPERNVSERGDLKPGSLITTLNIVFILFCFFATPTQSVTSANRERSVCHGVPWRSSHHLC